ncbi:MAG TPA: single-stranded DNA-binding protein, partial [Acidobacteriota bacterium]|nr:single-stranded DNA-binding protein [Acidobacteriota bacterium]
MRDVNSLNKVILVGRLGQNPETRVLAQTERKVVRFSLATNERFFNKNTSEAVNRTEWHRIVVWGPLADFCEKYLTQGKQIL